MKLPAELVEAVFVTRLNRFAVLVRRGGCEIMAHLPNSGRLHELLSPGNRMFLAPAARSEGRKTSHDLLLVEVDGCLVSTDARLPNDLVQEAIEARRLPQLRGYESLRREVVFHESRIDLMLSGHGGRCYVEVKSVTLVEGGTGLFPDSPTERGRKHVRSLVEAVKRGHRGVIAFVVQRSDAHAFAPNEDADPEFCQALRLAADSGVEIYAYRCRVTLDEIEISGPIPVRLGH